MDDLRRGSFGSARGVAADAWMLFLDELDGRALRERCLPWLASDEVARYRALSTDRLQLRYLASIALCRRSLSQYAPVDPPAWRFRRSVSGKPAIAAPLQRPSLRFSLSRTDGLAVCLVTSAGAAGVDVESTSRTVDTAAVARDFLSAAQRQQLETLPPVEQTRSLFKLWVLHEAYVKGTGRGLGATPERVRVGFGAGGAPLPMGNWRLFFYEPSATHVAAAAIRPRDGADVTVTWLRASLF
ncbi:MAG TPA: 4'-phosphopantetheinyl transferase superfamily protein [Candidatus Baltobacteraceae bacterium]